MTRFTSSICLPAHLRQLLLGFRRKSFGDGPRIAPGRYSWCHAGFGHPLKSAVIPHHHGDPTTRAHVLQDQDLRTTLLPPGRREPLGGRAFPPAGHRHVGATRSPPAERPTRCPAGLGTRLSLPVPLLSAHAQGHLPTITARRIGPALVFQRPADRAKRMRLVIKAAAGRSPLGA